MWSRQGGSSAGEVAEVLGRQVLFGACHAAEAPARSFHEPGGTGLLHLVGEDGDWFLALVFLADLAVVLLRHPFLFPLAAPALSLKGQLWKSF